MGQTNSADPDQTTPRHVASEQGLHCSLTGFSINTGTKKNKIDPDIPKRTNGLVQHITVQDSTSK